MFKRALLQLGTLIVCAAAGLDSNAAELSGAAPDLENARVTIPYSELKSLWTAAQQQREKKEEPKPPVESSLLSARYQLALKGDQVSGIAEFEAQVFTGNWIVMPLLGTQAQIESIEPADTQIITRDQYYALVTNHPGKQKLKIQFAVKLDTSAGATHLHLPVAPASINTLTVTGIPEKQALKAADATQVSAEKDNASFRLAPQDHLELAIVPEKSLIPPTPSRWKIGPQVFVQFADGKLIYEAHVTAHADSGSGLGMDLALPGDANISKITGTDLNDWQVTSAENGSRVAHVRWQTRDLLQREVEVFYDLPQPLTASEWKLQSPHIVDGEASPPLCVIALEPGLELTTATAQPPAPRQLPKWMASRAEGKNFLVITGEPPLQAKWLPLVQTAQAVADAAHAKMQIVADGAVLNEMEYAIRHEGAFAWKITLPAGSELLACSVDGRPVNPINRGEHVVEFSLPASGKAVSSVKLSYTAKGAAFKPVSGKIDIELPQTDLLISKLDWELHIPAIYEVAAFEGNVEPADGSGQTDATSRVVRLHKELCKGERPSAQLFYQKPEANK